jgi:hypothetical protein
MNESHLFCYGKILLHASPHYMYPGSVPNTEKAHPLTGLDDI